MGENKTPRDSAFYMRKAKELEAKEQRKKEIAGHKAALAKLTGRGGRK